MHAPTVRLCILGNLRLSIDDVPVPIAGKLKHRLLARLALRPGEAVEPDGLIEAMWGDHAPRTAKQSLHVHISHLRDRLRSIDAEGLVTTTAEGDYVLGTGTEVDASLFEALVDQGIAAFRDNNLRRSLDALQEAVTMWGDPYESLMNHYGAMAERHRLLAIHERAVDVYVDTLVALSEAERAIPILRATIGDESLRERPYVQLMQIYLAAGEGGLAAALYDQARETFGELLGIEPSAELAGLYDLIDAARPRQDPASSSGQLGFDVSLSALVHVPAAAETAALLEMIRAQANRQNRQVAHGRVAQGAVSSLSPMLELARMHDEPGVSRSMHLRHQLFDRVTHRLVLRHFVTPVVVIERFEHASQLLLDYLERALGSNGPAPFTVVALHSLPDQELHEWLSPSLVQIFEQQSAVALEVPDLPDLGSLELDEVEHSVLALLICALPPAASELLARASPYEAAAFAEALDRLVLRRVVHRETDGHVSLQAEAAVRELVALTAEDTARMHLALAAGFADWPGPENSHHVVRSAWHLVRALPLANWAHVAETTLQAFAHLESLGAYDDMVDLVDLANLGDGSPVAAVEWPSDLLGLRLRVALGRAEIRAGQSERGAQTLLRAIDLARDTGEGVLFADAVRAMIEERSPQRFDEETRGLIAEALELLGDRVSDTRVQLLTDMANSWYFVDLAKARTWAEQALELGRMGEPATVARALTGYMQANMRADNAAERLDLALEAQQWARRGDSTESLVLALTYEACALFELGDPHRADAPLRYAEALAADVQVPRFQWWVAAWRALLDFATEGGDLDSSEDRFASAYALWPTSTRADPFECLSAQIATLRIAQGRGEELLPVLELLANEAGQNEEVDLVYLGPAAIAYAQAGDHERARSMLDRLTRHPALERGDVTVPIALAFGAEAAYLVGDVSAAEVLHTWIEPMAHVHVTLNVWGGGGFYWGSMRHGFGLVQAVLGNVDGARASLRRALEQHQAAGLTTFADRSRDALAAL